jgi:hypothetical protein
MGRMCNLRLSSRTEEAGPAITPHSTLSGGHRQAKGHQHHPAAMQDRLPEWYATLGVARDASEEALRKAYRR